jgi:hypothetical protein
MIWLTARIAERSAYLLLEPQPPMNRPTISSDEMARKNSTPMFRSATPSSGANGMVAKMSRQGTRNTIGARLYTQRSLAIGTMSSFIMSLSASAMGWSHPWGRPT